MAKERHAPTPLLKETLPSNVCVCVCVRMLTKHNLSSCHKRVPTAKHRVSYGVIVASGYESKTNVRSERVETRVPHVDPTLLLSLDKKAIHHFIEQTITTNSHNTASNMYAIIYAQCTCTYYIIHMHTQCIWFTLH